MGPGELGVARGRRDGVNAQFVFRSGGKTRSLHRIARRTRRNSSSSPTFVSSLGSSRQLYIHNGVAHEKYELRERCINFPLESRRFLTRRFIP